MLPIRHEENPALERLGGTPNCLFNAPLRLTQPFRAEFVGTAKDPGDDTYPESHSPLHAAQAPALRDGGKVGMGVIEVSDA